MALFSKLSEAIKILKNAEAIKADMIPHPGEWYFSEVGHRAYDRADTLAEKMKYFFDYLLAVSPKKQKPEFLQRVAFIMAHSMEHSGMPFAGYPNILDEKLNPFVELIKNGYVSPKPDSHFRANATEDFDAAILLTKIHQKGGDKAGFQAEVEDYFSIVKKPYLKFDYPPNGIYTDIQKIERDIIWSRKLDEENELSRPPFCYDILTDIVVEEMAKKDQEESFNEEMSDYE